MSGRAKYRAECGHCTYVATSVTDMERHLKSHKEHEDTATEPVPGLSSQPDGGPSGNNSEEDDKSDSDSDMVIRPDPEPETQEDARLWEEWEADNVMFNYPRDVDDDQSYEHHMGTCEDDMEHFRNLYNETMHREGYEGHTVTESMNTIEQSPDQTQKALSSTSTSAIGPSVSDNMHESLEKSYSDHSYYSPKAKSKRTSLKRGKPIDQPTSLNTEADEDAVMDTEVQRMSDHQYSSPEMKWKDRKNKHVRLDRTNRTSGSESSSSSSASENKEFGKLSLFLPCSDDDEPESELKQCQSEQLESDQQPGLNDDDGDDDRKMHQEDNPASKAVNYSCAHCNFHSTELSVVQQHTLKEHSTPTKPDSCDSPGWEMMKDDRASQSGSDNDAEWRIVPDESGQEENNYNEVEDEDEVPRPIEIAPLEEYAPRDEQCYRCEQDGCKALFPMKADFIKHVKYKHVGSKIYHCLFTRCWFACTSRYRLIEHTELVHSMNVVNAVNDDCMEDIFTIIPVENRIPIIVAPMDPLEKLKRTRRTKTEPEKERLHRFSKIRDAIPDVDDVDLDKILQYECKINACPHVFFSRDAFSAHVKAEHIHEGGKIFYCAYCQFAATDPVPVRDHTRKWHTRGNSDTFSGNGPDLNLTPKQRTQAFRRVGLWYFCLFCKFSSPKSHVTVYHTYREHRVQWMEKLEEMHPNFSTLAAQLGILGALPHLRVGSKKLSRYRPEVDDRPAVMLKTRTRRAKYNYAHLVETGGLCEVPDCEECKKIKEHKKPRLDDVEAPEIFIPTSPRAGRGRGRGRQRSQSSRVGVSSPKEEQDKAEVPTTAQPIKEEANEPAVMEKSMGDESAAAIGGAPVPSVKEKQAEKPKEPEEMENQTATRSVAEEKEEHIVDKKKEQQYKPEPMGKEAAKSKPVLGEKNLNTGKTSQTQPKPNEPLKIPTDSCAQTDSTNKTVIVTHKGLPTTDTSPTHTFAQIVPSILPRKPPPSTSISGPSQTFPMQKILPDVRPQIVSGAKPVLLSASKSVLSPGARLPPGVKIVSSRGPSSGLSARPLTGIPPGTHLIIPPGIRPVLPPGTKLISSPAAKRGLPPGARLVRMPGSRVIIGPTCKEAQGAKATPHVSNVASTNKTVNLVINKVPTDPKKVKLSHVPDSEIKVARSNPVPADTNTTLPPGTRIVPGASGDYVLVMPSAAKSTTAGEPSKIAHLGSASVSAQSKPRMVFMIKKNVTKSEPGPSFIPMSSTQSSTASQGSPTSPKGPRSVLIHTPGNVGSAKLKQLPHLLSYLGGKVAASAAEGKAVTSVVSSTGSTQAMQAGPTQSKSILIKANVDGVPAFRPQAVPQVPGTSIQIRSPTSAQKMLNIGVCNRGCSQHQIVLLKNADPTKTKVLLLHDQRGQVVHAESLNLKDLGIQMPGQGGSPTTAATTASTQSLSVAQSMSLASALKTPSQLAPLLIKPKPSKTEDPSTAGISQQPSVLLSQSSPTTPSVQPSSCVRPAELPVKKETVEIIQDSSVSSTVTKIKAEPIDVDAIPSPVVPEPLQYQEQDMDMDAPFEDSVDDNAFLYDQEDLGWDGNGGGSNGNSPIPFKRLIEDDDNGTEMEDALLTMNSNKYSPITDSSEWPPALETPEKSCKRKRRKSSTAIPVRHMGNKGTVQASQPMRMSNRERKHTAKCLCDLCRLQREAEEGEDVNRQITLTSPSRDKYEECMRDDKKLKMKPVVPLPNIMFLLQR